MRVFVLSLLAIAAAHGATPATWGSGRMPTLRTAAAAPASNLALRGGGPLDFVKQAVRAGAVPRMPGRRAAGAGGRPVLCSSPGQQRATGRRDAGALRACICAFAACIARCAALPCPVGEWSGSGWW